MATEGVAATVLDTQWNTSKKLKSLMPEAVASNESDGVDGCHSAKWELMKFINK